MKQKQAVKQVEWLLGLMLASFVVTLAGGWCWKPGWGVCLGKNYPIRLTSLPCTEQPGSVQAGEFTESDVMMPEADEGSIGKLQKRAIVGYFEDVSTYLLVAVPDNCTNYIIPHYRVVQVWCQGATEPDPDSGDCQLAGVRDQAADGLYWQGGDGVRLLPSLSPDHVKMIARQDRPGDIGGRRNNGEKHPLPEIPMI
jgi:hypothetical protein